MRWTGSYGFLAVAPLTVGCLEKDVMDVGEVEDLVVAEVGVSMLPVGVLLVGGSYLSSGW